MINILVCISIVPDTTSKLVIDSSNDKIDKSSLAMIIGPYDEYALSKAVELKESLGANLTVLHVGQDSSAESILRKCLAIGADEAFRIQTNAISSKQVADEIIHFIQNNKFDLILMGKESIDSNNGLVHKMVANGLRWKQYNPVMQLNVKENNTAIILVEMENGTAELEVKLPLVLGCQEPISEWKIPSMRGIMAARTKPLHVIDPITSSKINHLSDKVLEKNRMLKVLKPENMNEIVEIFNQFKK